jgi:hypothetical protein
MTKQNGITVDPSDWKRGLLAAGCAVAMLLGTAGFVSISPARADSEASSEAGSESGALGARRARRAYRRQMQAERRHEKNVEQRTARDDNRRSHLTGRQTVQNYGNGGHRRNQPQSNTQQP